MWVTGSIYERLCACACAGACTSTIYTFRYMGYAPVELGEDRVDRLERDWKLFVCVGGESGSVGGWVGGCKADRTRTKTRTTVVGYVFIHL